MIIYEFKAKGYPWQYDAIDEAIRTAQFVRNKALRYWIDNKDKKVTKYDLNKYCRILAKEFPFAAELGSPTRQSAAERAWSAISRFYENCKRGIKPVGYPKFQKNNRSVEYKTCGWKLSENRKAITFTDKKNIGTLKLKGTYNLNSYQLDDIKRVCLVRRADGYYVQFCMSVEVKIETEPTGKAIGLDLGIQYFLADSDGNTVESPQFYRKAKKQLNRANRQKSKKLVLGATRQSKNYHKARNRYARKQLTLRLRSGLKLSRVEALRGCRHRQEYVKKLADCVIQSNDLIAYVGAACALGA